MRKAPDPAGARLTGRRGQATTADDISAAAKGYRVVGQPVYRRPGSGHRALPLPFTPAWRGRDGADAAEYVPWHTGFSSEACSGVGESPSGGDSPRPGRRRPAPAAG